MKNNLPLSSDIAIFCILAVLLSIIYFALPGFCLYDNDAGVKYIEMKACYLNNWKGYEIKYPGKSIGLGFQDLNMPEFFLGKGSKILGNFYLAFPFLSSIFYPFLRERVIHFLPLASFFLSIIVFSRILRMFKPARLLYYLLLLGFICASPLYLYSITFSEHIPLVFLVTLSLYFLARFFVIRATSFCLSLAFVFLSLGIFFRLACLGLLVCFAFSIFLYLRFKSEAKKAIPAFLLSGGILVIYFMLNYYLYAKIIIPAPQISNLFSYKSFFYLAAGLFTTAILFIFLSKGYKEDKENESLIGLLPLILVLALTSIPSKDKLSSTVSLFFSSFPLIALLFFDFSTNIKQFFLRNLGIKQVLSFSIILFLLFVTLGLREKPNLALGSFLVLIPLMFVFLCLHGQQIQENKGILGMIVVLLLVGFIFNLNYLKTNILKNKFYNASRYTFIKEHTQDNDIIIFTRPVLLEHAGPLFFERIYLACDNQERTDAVIEKFLKKGIAHFYVWAAAEQYADYFSKRYRDYKVINISVFSPKYYPQAYYLFEIKKNL